MVAPRKLLVVDDDRLIVQMLLDLFRGDFEVFTAHNGEEAIAVLRQQAVAAVVCDHMMPKVTGVEVLKQCIELQPHAARIMITASEKVQDLKDAVNIGRVHRFIVKPFRVLEVAGIVKGAIHERELERENELLVEELQVVLQKVRERERELEHELDVRTRELKDVMDHLLKNRPSGAE